MPVHELPINAPPMPPTHPASLPPPTLTLRCARHVFTIFTTLPDYLVVFCTLAITHLLFINTFGATWDEPLHRFWGAHYTSFLATWNRAIIDTLPGRGAYYGPLYHVINYLLSNTLLALFPLSFIAANHVLNVLTFAACCSAVLTTARHLFSRTAAWLSVFLFALIPPLIAHAHYNTTDVQLTLTATLTVLTTYLATQRHTYKAASLAGACFGAALAVKLSAALLLPPLALTYLGACCFTRRTTRTAFLSDLRLVGVGVLSAGATVYLLWPSLWADPSLAWRGLRTFQEHFWLHKVQYFGTAYDAFDLPWHYIPFYMLAILPVPTLGFFFAGCFIAVTRLLRGSDRITYILLLTWTFVPVLLSALPGLTRYDGYRQFFFTLPAVAIIAAVGLEYVAARLALYLRRGRCVVQPLIVCLSITWIAIDVATIFPYEGSYITPLARLPFNGDLGRLFELELWGATYKDGLAWINQNAAPSAVVCVPMAASTLSWYDVRGDITFGCNSSATYLMYFTRNTFLPATYVRQTVTPVFEIRRYNSRLLAIYIMP